MLFLLAIRPTAKNRQNKSDQIGGGSSQRKGGSYHSGPLGNSPGGSENGQEGIIDQDAHGIRIKALEYRASQWEFTHFGALGHDKRLTS